MQVLDVDCGAVRVFCAAQKLEDEEGVVCADRGEEIDKAALIRMSGCLHVYSFCFGTWAYVRDDVSFPQNYFSHMPATPHTLSEHAMRTDIACMRAYERDAHMRE